MPLINFDEASAIIAARWDDLTKPLHGLFCPGDPRSEQVLTYTPAAGEPRTYPARAMLFPYGEVLRKLTAARVGANPRYHCLCIARRLRLGNDLRCS